MYLLSCFISGVLEEAEFYNIDPLVRLVKEKIKARDAKLKFPVSTCTYLLYITLLYSYILIKQARRSVWRDLLPSVCALLKRSFDKLSHFILQK